MTDILREDQYTIYIISRSVLFKMRNVSGKRCGDKNTHFVFNIFFFFFFENTVVYETMGRSQVTT